MCGIVGYIGRDQAAPLLLEGLQSLEYRGYDSAGLAIGANGHGILVQRAAGKLQNLRALAVGEPLPGTYGIGHTRWATHGEADERNAHPHRDATGDIAVVHNGIVENYLSLRESLEEAGCRFASETDTEVIAHLIDKYSRRDGNLEKAVRRTIEDLQGIFALLAISRRDPDKLVVASSGPPALIGVGERAHFVASDVSALLPHTNEVLFLQAGEMAVVTIGALRVMDFSGRPVDRAPQRVEGQSTSVQKGDFEHFMLKEIFEQPDAVRRTFDGIALPESPWLGRRVLSVEDAEWSTPEHIRIVACGTSWHAALAGKYMIEELAGIPVEVDYASEFRYRHPIVTDDTLTIAISQSGETADTLAAQREASDRGSRTLAICNVPGSTLTRQADFTFLTQAGPEIGVASTKAFTSQLTAVFTLGLHLGRARGKVGLSALEAMVQELCQLPEKLARLLQDGGQVVRWAEQFGYARQFLFLGRGIHFPVALEAALKLKELSYAYAEGHPAGEMKHGPNALIDENLPIVVIATRDGDNERSRMWYEKTLANIKEVQARKGKVLAIGTQGDSLLGRIADGVIEIPAAHELLLPILEIVPLQLFAYHTAVLRGCDVDQPRNLAKSVTVE